MPVVMLLDCGRMACGAAGVLLAVSAPVKSCRVPELATVNWDRSKVMLVAALPALETCWRGAVNQRRKRVGPKGRRHGNSITLMKVWPELDERVTLQCNVPPLVGRVLGRYWSPRFVANSCVAQTIQ